ncbi:MAG: PilZ domain-containing protein [Gammaproteobacteria bacterium]
MEHRFNRRIALRTPVFIYRQGERVAMARARNLCVEGIFLETRVAGFRRNDYLELVMPLAGVQGRVPALVTHVAPDGLGLMLDPCSVAMRAALQRAAVPVPEGQCVVA